MDRKGQLTLGVILTVFISILVGLVLLQGSYQYIGETTLTNTYTNNTITLASVNSTVNLNGQAASSVILINATSGAVVPTNSYTVNNYVLSNGVLTTNIKTLDGAAYASRSVNASYVSEPYGYATNGGTRSIINLIAIFGGLS